jgi:tetratricopeptide (TPR) repeat protein
MDIYLKKRLMRPLVSFLLIVLTNFSIGQTAFRIEAVNELKAGDLELQYGNWEKALMHYTNAIQIDVSYAEAYYKRGQLYEKTAHSAEAALDYKQARLLNPYISIFYDKNALVQFVVADYYGALNEVVVMNDMLFESMDFESKSYHFVSLELYKHHKVYDEVELDSVHKKNALLHDEAIELIKEYQILDAKRIIEEGLNSDSSDYRMADLYGLILLMEEDLIEAKEWFDLSIKIEKSYFPAYYNRSIAHRFLGDIDQSKADVEYALGLESNKYFFYKLALLDKEEGNYEKAIDSYSKAIELDSTYNKALYNRAFTNKLLGNYEKASEDLEALLKEDPYNSSLWDLKGSIAMLQGNYEDALMSFNRAIQYDDQCAACYYHRGLNYTLMQAPLQGCEDFSKSIDMGLAPAQVLYDNFCGF